MVGKKNEFRQDTLAMMLGTAFPWCELGNIRLLPRENFGPVSAVVEAHGYEWLMRVEAMVS
tara:strand:+ start:3505 stop:3687 length:183 start_codon:yes stop_codon:yes gene_type:complete